MAEITEDDVRKLARLSSISLNDTQVAKFRDELSVIVGYVDQLSTVDVDGLEPTYQVTGLVNVMREDEIKPQIPAELLLKNAPATEAHQLKVKRVLE